MSVEEGSSQPVTLSIIVVTWNNEAYIAQALQSCIFQGISNYEVIVVYNKSEDNTLATIKSVIAGQEGLFTIIENSENVGLGEGRNQGIRVAKGEYILFLDGDDWFAPDGLSQVDKVLFKNKPEILYFNFARIFGDGRVVPNNMPKTLAEGWRSTAESRASLLRNFGVAWNRVYSSKFLRFNNLNFPVGLYEDILWNIEVLARAEKVYVIPDAITLYRQRDGSILRSQGMQHFDALIANRRVIDFFKTNPMYVEAFASQSYKAVRRQGYGMLTNGRLPWKSRREYLIQINKILAELQIVLRWKRLSFDEKIASLGSYLLFFAYLQCKRFALKGKRRFRGLMR